MSYEVIARKWRPQLFSDLVGQDHISQTLLNALRVDRLHHALLLIGPRGTGKTTTARIVAKSLCCPHAVDHIPCNQCDVCKEISTGTAIDVREMDGASNNSVDDVRRLTENVAFAASQGHFKVYIIDEVHMLSTSAFNALLKTLEEPPEHVKFIFATTEVHKIPATILSRCQRFEFRRISTKAIMERLSLICKTEGYQYQEEALWLIARQGDGSMRDSQSLLDQLLTFSRGELTYQNVSQILGLTSRHLIHNSLRGLINQDEKIILQVLGELSKSGADPLIFSQDLLEMIRNLIMIEVSAGQATTEFVDLPDSEIQELKQLAEYVSPENLHFLFDMALKGIQDLQRALDPKLVLEILLLRMTAAPRIEDLANIFQWGSQPQAQAPSKTTPPKSLSQETSTPLVSAKNAAAKKIPVEPETWLEFVNHLKGQDPLLSAKIEHLLFLGLKGPVIELGVPQKMQFLVDQMRQPDLAKKLQSFIDAFWGEPHPISVRLAGEKDSSHSAQSLARSQEKERLDRIREEVESHPLVRTVKETFNGQITSIKEHL